jgi:hypothetical protein
MRRVAMLALWVVSYVVTYVVLTVATWPVAAALRFVIFELGHGADWLLTLLFG